MARKHVICQSNQEAQEYVVCISQFEWVRQIIHTNLKANTMVSFTAVGPPVDGVEVAFTIDGIDLFTESLGFIFNSATLTLSDSQMQDIVSRMNSSTSDFYDY